MRQIDADSLMKRMCERCNEAMEDQPCEPSECFVREIIASVPTVDAEPVRHGRWKYQTQPRFEQHYDEPLKLCVYVTGYCSECGAEPKEAYLFRKDFYAPKDCRYPTQRNFDVKSSEEEAMKWFLSTKRISPNFFVLPNFCPNCGAKMDLEEA